MKFSIANRKLMKTIFGLGTVEDIGGTFEVGDKEMRWSVYYKKKTLYREKERYDAYITGIDCQMELEGDTLDEVLDALEDKMEVLPACCM